MSDPAFAPPTGDPSVLPAGAKLERVRSSTTGFTMAR
jgi:hypothetical protein